jgi:predicted aspartyl protease
MKLIKKISFILAFAIVFSMGIAGISSADTNTIHFRDFMGLILFECEINDQKGMFLLDSGADTSIVDTGFAKRAGLEEIRGPLGILGAGAVSQYKIDRFVIGEWFFDNTTTTGIDLSIVDRYLGFELMGIVGGDVLSKYVLSIDYQNDVFTLSDQAPVYKNSAAVIPIRIIDKLVFAKASPCGSGDDFTFLVDTGATSLVYFKNRIEQTCPNYTKWPASLGWLEATFLGKKEADIYLMPEFSMGGTGIESVITTVTEAGILGLSLNILSGSPLHGIVGWTFLRNYKVTFDYPRQRMILEPYEVYTDKWPHLFDSVGIMIAYENGVPIIEHLLPNTPASESSIEIGDILVEVDGRQAKTMDSLEISELIMGEPGTSVTLVLKRGSQEYRVQLKRVNLFSK